MHNLRPIPGFNGIYSMNADGAIYREQSTDARGHLRNTKFIKASIHGRGYLYVRLSLNGHRKMYSLNTLINKTFPERTQLRTLSS
ncbi:hypothetical protein [Periweissella beninensis]|uniref:NUMOD4 domain-containing protein n=1 Tax=Periweissella beninensis TaxID=504936 RepID=A0ABT0VJN0_9LACO|nr:hypothetical protein [Periweissella beninensis]MBM7544447.1 hypothetical protein [Periweissella beninensis]MCM2437866.1 hypothetical protein [Periweissella beninensis]MCT4396724.1 hypothetical protein [Periweissella beninensis]